MANKALFPRLREYVNVNTIPNTQNVMKFNRDERVPRWWLLVVAPL